MEKIQIKKLILISNNNKSIFDFQIKWKKNKL